VYNNPMPYRNVRRICGVLILLASFLLLAWGFWPGVSESHLLLLSPANMQLPRGSSSSSQAALPAILEPRLLALKWPSKIRVGETETIRVTIKSGAPGDLAPAVLAQSSPAQTEPQPAPNIYNTHDVLASGHLELPGVLYIPEGEISEALRPGQPVTFIWQVRPSQPGVYQGTVWLHLRFIPLGGGAESRIVLTAQRIEIEAGSFLGLGTTAARLLGSFGTIAGLLLVIDFESFSSILHH